MSINGKEKRNVINFSFKERKEILIYYGEFGKINFLVPEYVFILHDVLE